MLRDLRAILRLPSALETSIAARYLRSRRSRRASLNTVISTGGVAVGVMALIVVLGVMNGLRNDSCACHGDRIIPTPRRRRDGNCG